LHSILKINNAVEQSHWLNKLSATLRVREEDLRKRYGKIKDDYSPAYPIIEDRVEPVVQKQKTRQDLNKWSQSIQQTNWQRHGCGCQRQW